MNELISKNFYNLFSGYVFSKTCGSFLCQKNGNCDQKDINLISRMFKGKLDAFKFKKVL